MADYIENAESGYRHPIRAVFVVGPSSTGKTTLCDAMISRVTIQPLIHIKEVARTVMKETRFTRKDVGTIEMQLAIMTAQYHAERRAHTSAGGFILADRSAIDAVVYAGIGYPPVQKAERRKELMDTPEFQEALSRYRSSRSLFLLLTPVAKWVVDDGVRSIDNAEECCKEFREVLKSLNIGYKELGVDVQGLEERVSCLKRWSGW